MKRGRRDDARLRRRPTRHPVMAMFFVGLFVATSSVSAQDVDYDPSILNACLAAKPASQHGGCIGLASDACSQTPAGSSTVGLGYCYTSEWEQWDARLNAAYQVLLEQQAELAEDNAAFNPNIPDAVEQMRQMQRNWIAFRDAACAWEAIQWSGGTGQGPASAACMMRLTAQQALFLEARQW